MQRQGWIGCVAASLLVGCLGTAEDAPDGTEVAEIVVGPNTVTDTDVQPRWPQVVRVCGGGSCCSGTVVSPAHVLTAGHCGIPAGGTVNLDTPATGGSGTGRRAYNVVQAKTRSSVVASGNDLMLLVLDPAIPSFGPPGAPAYSVKPTVVFANISNTQDIWTVGYGFGNDCVKTGSGVRRGLRYVGGFATYPSFPNVITRANPVCDDINKGPSPGDSGGPLLDAAGRLVGVFSGWFCRTSTGANAAGCAGTIEWSGLTSTNLMWLNNALLGDFDGDGLADVDDPRPGLSCRGAVPPLACANLKSDFEITRIVADGCSGGPLVKVTIRNNGAWPGDTLVDVFTGLPLAPPIGTTSALSRRSNVLRERETQDLWFTVPRAFSSVRVDAIADTRRQRDELDEGNNLHSEVVTLAACL